MLRHIFLLITLALTWYLLSGYNSSLLLTLGAISCVISCFFYQKIVRRCDLEPLNLRVLKLFTYSLWLLKEIVTSASRVIQTIIFNRPIAPQFFHVDASQLSTLEKVIYANSITLTPGTVTIDIEQHHLYVYGLFADAKASLETGEMRDKVQQLTKR